MLTDKYPREDKSIDPYYNAQTEWIMRCREKATGKAKAILSAQLNTLDQTESSIPKEVMDQINEEFGDAAAVYPDMSETETPIAHTTLPEPETETEKTKRVLILRR